MKMIANVYSVDKAFRLSNGVLIEAGEFMGRARFKEREAAVSAGWYWVERFGNKTKRPGLTLVGTVQVPA